MPDMGEQVAGAYLLVEEQCDIVTYNVKPMSWSYGELDIIALRFETMTVFLCEVTTHIRDLVYGNSTKETFDKVCAKYAKQQEYAIKNLSNFNVRYMLWSPRVGPKLLSMLQQIDGIEFMLNEDYTRAVEMLKQHARNSTKIIQNDYYRALQINEHLRQ